MITQERLQEVLHYDPETGVFSRMMSRGPAKVGYKAGSIDKGYRLITIDYRRYYAHRLAWLYVFGSMPENELDHINGDKEDNRIENLRESDHTFNGQNQRRPHRNNRSGYLGVAFSKNAGKWRAEIQICGRKHHIGYFNCPTAAYFLGYLPAKRKYHEFSTI